MIDQREQTYLIVDAVIPAKVSSLPWENVDVNMLKKYKEERIKCDYLPIYF